MLCTFATQSIRQVTTRASTIIAMIHETSFIRIEDPFQQDKIIYIWADGVIQVRPLYKLVGKTGFMLLGVFVRTRPRQSVVFQNKTRERRVERERGGRERGERGREAWPVRTPLARLLYSFF